MVLYVWTIKASNRQPIERVTEIDELHGVLRVLNLPGMPNPADITTGPDGVKDAGKFRHIDVEGGLHWSVSWTKVV